MDKYLRFATGDKIEIIDKTSQYFGKTGVVIGTEERPLIILNHKSGTITILKLKLEGINSMVDITNHPNPLQSQIRKLE
jgi:hypothetical protein